MPRPGVVALVARALLASAVAVAVVPRAAAAASETRPEPPASGPDLTYVDGVRAPGSFELGLYAVDGAAGGRCRAREDEGAVPVPRDPTDPLQLRYLAEHYGGSAARLVALRTMIPGEDGQARCDATLAFAPEILYVGARAHAGAGGRRARMALSVRTLEGGVPLAEEARDAALGEDLALLLDPRGPGAPCLVATLTAFDARATGERQHGTLAAARGGEGAMALPPRLLVQYNPSYPLVAASDHRAGEVILGLLVDEAGQVPVVEILSYPEGGEDLVRSAVDAAHRWVFLPGTGSTGRPVKALVTVVLRFRLPNAQPS